MDRRIADIRGVTGTSLVQRLPLGGGVGPQGGRGGEKKKPRACGSVAV